MITKESGESGFFEEKIAPALRAGVPVYMITRPALPKHYEAVYGPVGLRKAVERLCPDFFPLKTGFTTGSTATAATTAALIAHFEGGRPSSFPRARRYVSPSKSLSAPSRGGSLRHVSTRAMTPTSPI